VWFANVLFCALAVHFIHVFLQQIIRCVGFFSLVPNGNGYRLCGRSGARPRPHAHACTRAVALANTLKPALAVSRC